MFMFIIIEMLEVMMLTDWLYRPENNISVETKLPVIYVQHRYYISLHCTKLKKTVKIISDSWKDGLHLT